MQIAILHNAVSDAAALEDQDTLFQVETVRASLERLGHVSEVVPCTLNLADLQHVLAVSRPEMVFNLVESLADSDSLAYLAPALLDAMNIRYAGNRTEALFLTTHKLLAKRRMRDAGLPTPDWIDGVANLTEHHGKSAWILKGIWDQASRGMEDDAVLKDVGPREVQQCVVERSRSLGRPCFAEQYIEGREFNISVLADPAGPRVLTPAEIDFSAFPPEKPRIVGHKAKWQADSFEYHNTPRSFVFPPADRPLLDQLRQLTSACWRLFDLRGWARVDFRVDRSGRPWILEINANPCLSPDAGFAAALEQAVIPFDNAIQNILEDSR